MGAPPKKPVFRTVTYQVRSKPRFGLVKDQVLLEVMRQAGIPLAEPPRLPRETGGELVGIYALPTNNVLEVYRGTDGQEVGLLFTSLDVWMTYADGVDYG